jgi:hypothetical protein
MFPNFIKLTWENQKTSISMFLNFRDPNGVQITWNFAGASFFMEQDLGAKEMQHGSHEGQTSMAHAARFLGRVGLACSPLVALIPSIFVLLDLSWPKTNYIKGAPAGREEERHWNTKTRNRNQVDQRSGKTPGGALPVWSPSPPTTLPLSPWWRGSSPPLDYRFVAVAICISLVLHCIRAIWAA